MAVRPVLLDCTVRTTPTERPALVGAALAGRANVARSAQCGGQARTTEISGMHGASPYRSNHSAGPNENWQPNGCLHDLGGGVHSAAPVSTRPSASVGSTWNSGGAHGVGVLVVDLGKACALGSFAAFQMCTCLRTHTRVGVGACV